jgi:transposase-like protein
MTMREETRGELTLAEQRLLERVQEAASEGVSLRDYYRAHGLSVTMLYKVRRRLVQKGLLPPLRQSAGTTEVPGKLVEVRVTEAMQEAEVALPGLVCRVHHPSGWLIECGEWPDPRWLAGLMGARP